jgi:hypothetical protein
VSKDKKKKKKDKSEGQKKHKLKVDSSLASATKGLKAIAENPLVADVVAAALVATASALKDSNKARRLASEAGDQLGDMAKESADRGGEMWKLALQIGRQTLDAIASDQRKKGK